MAIDPGYNRLKKSEDKRFFGYYDVPYQSLICDFLEGVELPNYLGKFYPYIEEFMPLYKDDVITSELIDYLKKDRKAMNTIALIQLGRLAWALEILDRGFKKFENEYVAIDTWFMILAKARGFKVSSSLKENVSKFFNKTVDLSEIEFPEADKHYLGIYDLGVGVEYEKDIKSLEKKGYAVSELYSLDLAFFKFMAIRLRAYNKKANSKKVKKLLDFFDMYKNKADYTEAELRDTLLLLSEVLPNIDIDSHQ